MLEGMIISNSMVAIGLSYTNLSSSFKTRLYEVEVKLSLGSDIYLASTSISRIIATYIAYKSCFNERIQVEF